MRYIERFILHYWFPLTLGMFITAALVLVMLPIRGRFAIGGEWMFTPVLLAAHMLLRDHYKRKRRRERALRRHTSHA